MPENIAQATLNFNAQSGQVREFIASLEALNTVINSNEASIQNLDQVIFKAIRNLDAMRVSAEQLKVAQASTRSTERSEAAKAIAGLIPELTDEKATAKTVANIREIIKELNAIQQTYRQLKKDMSGPEGLDPRLFDVLKERMQSAFSKLNWAGQVEAEFTRTKEVITKEMAAIEQKMRGAFFMFKQRGDPTSGGSYRTAQERIGRDATFTFGSSYTTQVQEYDRLQNELAEIAATGKIATTVIETLDASVRQLFQRKYDDAERSSIGKQIEAIERGVDKWYRGLSGESVDQSETQRKAQEDAAMSLRVQKEVQESKVRVAQETAQKVVAISQAETQAQIRAQRERLAMILKTENQIQDSFARTGTAFYILYTGQRIIGTATQSYIKLNAALTQTQAILQGSEYAYQRTAEHLDTLGSYVDDLSLKIPLAAVEIEKAFDIVFQATEATTKQAAEYVELAGKMSVATGQSVEKLMPLLMGIHNAYRTSTTELAHDADVMVRAWKDGVFTFEEAYTGLSRLIQSGKIANVTFEELMAMFVGVTKEGGNASRNITMLVNVLNSLQSPEKQKTMQEGGLDTSSSILGQLKQIKAFAEKDPQFISRIFTDQRARLGVQLLVSELDTVNKELQKMIDTTGDVDAAFKINIQSAAFRLQRFENQMAVIQREFGKTMVDAFLPLIELLGNLVTSINEAAGPLSIVVDAVKGLAIPLSIFAVGLAMARAQMMLFNLTLPPGISGMYAMLTAVGKTTTMMLGLGAANMETAMTEEALTAASYEYSIAMAFEDQATMKLIASRVAAQRTLVANVGISQLFTGVTIALTVAFAAYYIQQGYINAKIEEYNKLAEEATTKSAALKDEIVAMLTWQNQHDSSPLKGRDLSTIELSAEALIAVNDQYKAMQLRLDALDPKQEKLNENMSVARQRLIEMANEFVEAGQMVGVTTKDIDVFQQILDSTIFTTMSAEDQIALLQQGFDILSTAQARNELEMFNAKLEESIKLERAAYEASLYKETWWQGALAFIDVTGTGFMESQRNQYITERLYEFDQKWNKVKEETKNKLSATSIGDIESGSPDFQPPSETDTKLDKVEELYKQIQAAANEHELRQSALALEHQYGLITEEENIDQQHQNSVQFAKEMIQYHQQLKQLTTELGGDYGDILAIVKELFTKYVTEGADVQKELWAEAERLKLYELQYQILMEQYEVSEKRRLQNRQFGAPRTSESDLQSEYELRHRRFQQTHPFMTPEDEKAFRDQTVGMEIHLTSDQLFERAQAEREYSIYQADKQAENQYQSTVLGFTRWSHRAQYNEQRAKMDQLNTQYEARRNAGDMKGADEIMSQIESIAVSIQQSMPTLTNTFRDSFLTAIEQMAQSIATTGKINLGQVFSTFGSNLAAYASQKVSTMTAKMIANSTAEVGDSGEGFTSAALGGLAGAGVGILFGLLGGVFKQHTHVNTLEAVPVRVINFAEFMQLFTLPQSAYFAPMRAYSVLQNNYFSTATAPGISRDISVAINPENLYREFAYTGAW